MAIIESGDNSASRGVNRPGSVLDFIKYVVTFFSIITSLIAAYMKKENYVERIKEMDRYIQKVGIIHMQLEGIHFGSTLLGGTLYNMLQLAL